MPSTCTCDCEEVGNGETGPILHVEHDVLCPQHGRRADPGFWSVLDQTDGYGTGWYLLEAETLGHEQARERALAGNA